MDREDLINQTVRRDMFGLEIGPSYSASFPKRDGWNVEMVDHASAGELREKYGYLAESVNIEEVDYIWQGGLLSDAVPKSGCYDFVYASHVIEHMIDPIGFIVSCEHLLKPGGQLILVVPDKRQCFDFLRPVNSLGNLLDSHMSPSKKHRFGAVFDFYGYSADLGGHAVWESGWAYDHSLKPSFSHSNADEAYGIARRADSLHEYSDVHAWNFVPSSFRLIMNDMFNIGLTSLRETLFATTQRCEFYYAASANGSGPPKSRLEIVRDMAQEQILGLQQIIAT